MVENHDGSAHYKIWVIFAFFKTWLNPFISRWTGDTRGQLYLRNHEVFDIFEATVGKNTKFWTKYALFGRRSHKSRDVRANIIYIFFQEVHISVKERVKRLGVYSIFEILAEIMVLSWKEFPPENYIHRRIFYYFFDFIWLLLQITMFLHNFNKKAYQFLSLSYISLISCSLVIFNLCREIFNRIFCGSC